MGLTAITNIPKIMRAKGWLNGARLMDEWFSGAPAVKPAYTGPDLTTIKMDSWALGFSRAKKVFDAMVQERVWSNEHARPVLARRLGSLGLLIPAGCCFDLSAKTVQDQHNLHVNFRSVENSFWSALDDMDAALANFSIYVTPLHGEIAAEGARLRVKLMKVGFHIWDSYDFNGDQDLGYWDETTNQVSSSFMFRGTKVTNESFRKWRSANGKGGDFLVYSDVKPLFLTPPDSFLI